MSRKIGTLLTARSTVIALLAVLAAVMVIAAVVPQVGLEAEGGLAQRGLPTRWTGLVDALGLDRIFSTRWFATLAVLFVASLAVSAIEQLRLARARTFQVPPECGGEPGVQTALSPDEVSTVLRAAGYRRLAAAPGRSRHVRNWQGYWGNFLLHAGMVITALFALVYVLTEHRSMVEVATGEPVLLSDGRFAAKRGLLARAVPLPAQISLYRVEPTFGANGQLVDLASELVFRDQDGTARDVRVAVNDYQSYRGLVVYQVLKYGNVFDVHAADAAGRSTAELRLRLVYPEKPGGASYATEPLAEGQVLKAKYVAAPARTGVSVADGELVVRLYEGERLLGEAALREGQESRLGGTTLRLVRAGWWTEVLFEGSAGTSGVFAGFAVLLLGATLVFFFVPREVVVREAPGGGCAVHWRSTRFAEMFHDEREQLLDRIGRKAS